MAYAAIGEGLDAEYAIRLLGRKGSEYKNGHLDFAGCPIAMQQAHGLCCGRKGLNAEPAIRLSDRKDSI